MTTRPLEHTVTHTDAVTWLAEHDEERDAIITDPPMGARAARRAVRAHVARGRRHRRRAPRRAVHVAYRKKLDAPETR